MALYSLTLPSQLLQLVLSGLVFSVLLLIFNFIILPLTRLQYYKKQGILTQFIPLLGFFALLKDGEKDHDDNLYHMKKNAQKNPNLEIEAYNIGNKAFLMLYSPRLFKSFLTSDENYQKYKRLQPITLFSKLGFAALNGRIYKEHRKIVAKLFSYDHLSRKLPTMHANALKVVDAIVKTQNLKNVALQTFTLEFAADNFADVFFGGHTKNYFVDGKPILNFTIDLQGESGILTRTLPLILFGPGIVKFGLLKSHRDFNGRVKRLKAEVNRLIQDRKSKTDQREVDLLDILLETQKSNDPDVAYTDEMIVGEYTSLFVSSAENPSHLIVLCLYLLDKHPEFKKKIMEEIHDIYDKEPLSSHTLHKMNHMHALLQETLRLQSPSFSSQPRIAMKDFKVENYDIKKGTVIMPIFFHQNYNETVFEDALKFKPERWLDQSLHLDPYRFIPFSAGPRNCIGQHFSGLEIKLMLCEFLKKFDYQVSPDFKLIKTQRFLNVPKDPILLNLTLRENM
jgi:cytochrome P450